MLKKEKMAIRWGKKRPPSTADSLRRVFISARGLLEKSTDPGGMAVGVAIRWTKKALIETRKATMYTRKRERKRGDPV